MENKQIGWIIQLIGTTPELKLTLKCGTTSVQPLQLKLPAVTHTHTNTHTRAQCNMIKAHIGPHKVLPLAAVTQPPVFPRL